MAKYQPFTGKVGEISADEIDLKLKQIASITGDEADLSGKKPERFERLMALQAEWGEALTESDMPDDVAPEDNQGEGNPDKDLDQPKTQDEDDDQPPATGAALVPEGKRRVVATKTFQVFDKDAEGGESVVFCLKGDPADLHPDIARDVIDAGAGKAVG